MIVLVALEESLAHTTYWPGNTIASTESSSTANQLPILSRGHQRYIQFARTGMSEEGDIQEDESRLGSVSGQPEDPPEECDAKEKGSLQ